MAFQFSNDIGRIVENIVFLELKRRGMEIYYWKGKGEVDFLIQEGQQTKNLIQVCWNLDDKVRKKAEVNSLIEAMIEFDHEKAQIITDDLDCEEMIEGKKIMYTPLWKWLLGRDNS